MTKNPAVLEVVKKPVIALGAAVLLVVVVVWLLVFFMPQSHKLSSLQAERASLQQSVVQDDARLQKVRTESHHVGQIQTLYNTLNGYVPATEDLYTFIQTLSSAGKAAGVTFTSLQPGALEAVPSTSYSAVPITAEVKGTYDHLVSFIHAIYGLPRLTDINSVNVTGGGPGTNRTTVLSATLNLAIFTSQTASSS